jgi:predicted CopG family antitoxin
MGEQCPTIKISNQFKDWLEKQGKKGESYEDVIKRLMPSWKDTHKLEVKMIEKKNKSGKDFREMKSIWVEK